MHLPCRATAGARNQKRRLKIMLAGMKKQKQQNCRNRSNSWNGTKEDWNGNCRSIRRKRKLQMRGSILRKYVPEKDKI